MPCGAMPSRPNLTRKSARGDAASAEFFSALSAPPRASFCGAAGISQTNQAWHPASGLSRENSDVRVGVIRRASELSPARRIRLRYANHRLVCVSTWGECGGRWHTIGLYGGRGCRPGAARRRRRRRATGGRTDDRRGAARPAAAFPARATAGQAHGRQGESHGQGTPHHWCFSLCSAGRSSRSAPPAPG